MQREIVHIGGIKYLIERIETDEILSFNYIYSVNIMDKSPVVSEVLVTHPDLNTSVYPVLNQPQRYSYNYYDFVKYGTSNTKSPIEGKCWAYRIHKPSYINIMPEFIIDIVQTGNGDIDFHIFCGKSSELPIHSETIIEEAGESYSEYIEVIAPNLIVDMLPYTVVNVVPYEDSLNDTINIAKGFTPVSTIFMSESILDISSKFVVDPTPSIRVCIGDGTLNYYANINNLSYSDYSNGYNNGNKLICKLEFARDSKFKQLYNDDELNSTIIENPIDLSFDIPIPSYFSSWKVYPEILQCRLIIIDEISGIVRYGTPILINEDRYKYLVSFEGDVKDIQNALKDMNLNITNHVCNIVPPNTSTSIDSVSNTQYIIKPIFYKVNPIESITIISGLRQNIGIDLSTYMSKVSVFRMHIGNNVFTERGRNGIYVLFDINASLITSKSGVYHITNQDDDYISSGSWVIE